MQTKEEVKRQVSVGLPLSIVDKIDRLKGRTPRGEYLRDFIIEKINKIKEE